MSNGVISGDLGKIEPITVVSASRGENIDPGAEDEKWFILPVRLKNILSGQNSDTLNTPSVYVIHREQSQSLLS